MRRALGRMLAAAALGAVGLTAVGGAVLAAEPPDFQSPGPEPGSPEQMAYFADTCRKELQRPPTQWGRVDNVTSPGPGTAVGGDVIDIHLAWDPADWSDTWVEKVLNCVSIDGVPVPELSHEERPAPNDGAYDRQLVVPEDIAGGLLLCEQGFVYGMFSRGGYTLTSSPRVCFTTQAAPPPTTTTTTEPPTTTTEAPTTTTTVPEVARVSAEAPPPPPPPVMAQAPAPAPAPATLPKTGAHDRLLLLGAGLALALGGLAVAGGARRGALSVG